MTTRAFEAFPNVPVDLQDRVRLVKMDRSRFEERIVETA